jgi:hypothetical protein
MFHPKSKFNRLCLTLCFSLFPLHPILAHTVKTAADVAATFHLEPSHNPKAGEPASVWFALTKIGGEIVPLQDCDCKLVVQQFGKAIAQPTLKAINAEQYQGIPGSTITFPAVGIYKLELTGQPKQDNAFQPFQLSYEVTVQPGNPAPTQSPSPTNPAPIGNPIGNPIGAGQWLIGGAIVALIASGLVRKNRQP